MFLNRSVVVCLFPSSLICYNKRTVTGGIQMIVAGSFKQLAPVPNYSSGDDGDYCFQSEVFNHSFILPPAEVQRDLDIVRSQRTSSLLGVCHSFPQHIHLTQVLRQKENDLIQAVNELCESSPSEGTMKLLEGLSNEINLPEGERLVKLHGTNFDVDFVNTDALQAFQNHMKPWKQFFVK